VKVTIFTGNRPRHIAFIEFIAGFCDTVYAIQISSSVFPYQYGKYSSVLKDYFQRVNSAEQKFYGQPRFLGNNVFQIPIASKDIHQLSQEGLQPALESDLYIIYGFDFIQGKLCQFLVKRKAIIIHMGIAPEYHGHASNFWALYDRQFDKVGVTVHLLTERLDQGPVLYHVLPSQTEMEPFEFGMNLVRNAYESIPHYWNKKEHYLAHAVPQDLTRRIRYTCSIDFTEQVALEYLKNLPSAQEIEEALEIRDLQSYVNPWIGTA
jgi:hypothetical protein|tara:strand:+ start:554 stop:1345 length:792 start_codon:yes stop_codon:yes gene_type:complete